MEPILQNHPYFRQSPVNNNEVIHYLNHTQNDQEKERFTNIKSKNRVSVVMGIIYFCAAILIIRWLLKSDDIHLIWTIVFSLLSIFLLLLFIVNFSNRGAYKKAPTKDQLQYYEFAKIQPLSLKQRQALRLDIVHCYYYGYWIETLDLCPLHERVKGDTYVYATFELEESETYRQQLYSSWGIADKADYEETFHALLAGMHSKNFAFDMYFSNNPKMVKNLAWLIEESEEYVNSCIEPQPLDQRPPMLLWGFDLWRAVFMSRCAFAAGYITEEEAWNNLYRVANYVYAIFPSLKDFYTNYRLGHAYWSDEVKHTKERLARYRLYEAHCDWPMSKLPWPSDDAAELPREIKVGFMDEIMAMRDSLAQEKAQSILEMDDEMHHESDHYLH